MIASACRDAVMYVRSGTMKSVLRYDLSGAVHVARATDDAIEYLLVSLDNLTRTTLVLDFPGPDVRQTSLSIHGRLAGPLVCSWVRAFGDEMEFERWLLGPGGGAAEIRVRVWGEDTVLPGRFAVSGDAVRLHLRRCLEGEDLEEYGPWEDAF